MNRRLMKISCLALGLACCSPSSTGSGTINGTILGGTLAVKSSLSYTTTSQTIGSTTVVLGTWPNGCALGARVNPKNSQALVFVFEEAGAGSATLRVTSPGQFTVGAAPRARVGNLIAVRNDRPCPVTRVDTR